MKIKKSAKCLAALLLLGSMLLCSCSGGNETSLSGSDTETVVTAEETTTANTENFNSGEIMLSQEIIDGTLKIYSIPENYKRSENATVKVNGHEAPLVYCGSVFYSNSNYDYCNFSVGDDQDVTVEIETNAEQIAEYEISCQSTAPQAEINGKKLIVRFKGHHNMIIRIDNLREIVLCVDAPETDIPQSSGEGIYNVVTDYGADSTGATLATLAFHKAIRDASSAGGGTVYVPNGVYQISNLILYSNVSVYLESGAYLMCTKDTSKLTQSELKTAEHGHAVKYPIAWMFSTATNSENIRIYGRGTIDGRGAEIKAKYRWLVALIRPTEVKGLKLEGVTFRDSSHWGTIVYNCDEVEITGTKHLNLVKNLNENDGIDICSSRNVKVIDTLVISQDDPYSVKSYMAGESKDILFENGLTWTLCAATKIGYGHVTNVQNVVFRDITAHRCMFGINITHYQGRADTVDCVFEGITVNGFVKLGSTDTAHWLFIDYKDDSVGGNIKNISISNVKIATLKLLDSGKGDASQNHIDSLSDEAYVDGVCFDNIEIEGNICTTLEDMYVTVSEHAKNITVKTE